MSLMITAMRRSIWLLLIGAVGGVAWGGGATTTRHRRRPLPQSGHHWSLRLLRRPPTSPIGSRRTTMGRVRRSHPIKANDNSNIFHVPGGRFYERTRAERCYATAEAAIADGYRQAKA